MAVKNNKKEVVEEAVVKKLPKIPRKRTKKIIPENLETVLIEQAPAGQVVAVQMPAEPVVLEQVPVTPSMKVLLVEDDYFTRSVYESELHQQNIEVISASNGQEGLAEARKSRPCIIVLELILPKLNGFEFIKEIRQDPVLKNSILVVASILSQPADREEAMSLGANKYLSKNDYSTKQIITEVVNLMAAQL